MMDEFAGLGAATQRKSGLAAYFRRVWAVAAKEVRTELRAGEILVAMAAFAVLAAVVFGLAFDLRVPVLSLSCPEFCG